MFFYLCYNLISILLLFPVIAYHLYRSLSRGRQPAFGQRFGLLPDSLRQLCRQRRVIWVHAVSVGETIASRPLLKGLRERYPDHLLLVSNTTETGQAIVASYGEVDGYFYFPFDFLPSVRLALDSLNPAMVIIMETEIWPNFNREAARRGIPLFLANGRISDRSYRRYQTYAWFFRHPLHDFALLCMQTELDRKRIISIGAPPARVMAVGNLKYDIPISAPDHDQQQSLRQEYGIPDGVVLLVAASTHSGEEPPVIEAYRRLLEGGAPLLLVLVPRHPERGDEVAALLRGAGLTFVRRTEQTPEQQCQAGQVLLVDTVGELMKLYRLSDLAYVGGSLVATGGHNLLEPASVGIPSVFGPHMTNFREITELVLSYGAGIQVANGEELYDRLAALVASPELRGVLGRNGLKLMRDNGGATERHLAAIAALV